MSITFEEELTEGQKKILSELVGAFQATDGIKFLFNNLREPQVEEWRPLGRSVIKRHPIGDVVTMRDGTQYEVTPKGWKKLKKQT